MIVLPRTPTGRIALTIALSALIHAIVLTAPPIGLPSGITLPAPLHATLEPRPMPAPQAAPHKRPEPLPRKKLESAPQLAAPAPEALPAEDLPGGTERTEDAQDGSGPQPAEPPAVDGTSDEAVQEIQPTHPLPRHLQLLFAAYKGTDFKVGEARHQLDISADNRYTLQVGMNTTGLASIFKTFESTQLSSGTLTDQGLRPDQFSETRGTSGGREEIKASFSWEENMLSFSNGSRASLPEQTQDIISFLYQFSQLALDKEVVLMHISNGKKLERYELVVGIEEMIQTRLGRLRTVPLHKVHAQGEEGLEVWLGLEYRLLPVKIRQIDRAGHIAGELVITEIRMADDTP